MSVEGEVVEIKAVQPGRSGEDVVPMRRMILDQDTSRIQTNLWREAAVLAVSLGDRVRVTHMKCSNTDYGLQLRQTTQTLSFRRNVHSDRMTDLWQFGSLQQFI
ncbi:hypothetical protein CgunFtcFv8_026241 [Champsocephalus gunnari]|uniref:Uncharacterized protein n=1 Tax=Champsocephalus gunnari TaxID=52237 RepID=A0AAN8CCI5_CHAGU|nr:hypothetical protein CgunFtcFv8_026241 [Champsocephalus gunnari]